jgi:hypothetical protein|tara:strand:+ start:526 stop:1362 length:837 start_codon:yes stop_codon:yes gene_type:complete
MRNNLIHIIILLIITVLVGCNNSPKDEQNNSNSYSKVASVKLDNGQIAEEFNWDITNSEKGEPYFEKYSLIKFTYQGKEYTMDTLYSRVSPCDFLDTAFGEPCSNLKTPDVVGAYFGADPGLFCYGKIMDKGDSLQYLLWFQAEEDEETNSETVVTTFKKKSTNKPKSNEIDKYTGNYTSQDEACDIKISVEKSDLLYKYQLTTATLKNSGNIKIDTVKNNVYFLFTNLNSESEGYAIEAQVNDDELTIQNYGNAMNQYHHIKDCDVKYIHLTKEQTN